MNNTNTVTQEQLDACSNMLDKFKLRPPEIYYEMNERGMSQLFADITHPYLTYNVTRKSWMFYNGNFWETDTGSLLVQREMKQFTRALLVYAVTELGNTNEEFSEFVESLSAASKRNTLIKDSTDYNYSSDDLFDTDIFLVNCINGTYNLKTQILQPHNPNDMITKIIRANYTPGAYSAVLDKFLNDIFCNNQDVIRYVLRALGYSLSGLNNQECLFIFLGETTRNGKSTLLNTFSYLLGEGNGYSRNTDVASLGQRKATNGSAPSSDICRLRGSRFVVASEPKSDFVFDEGRIKTFTGNDTITARMLYQNDVEFKPTFKIFIGTNNRPNVNDDSILESFRLRVVPFNRHFTAEEQNRNLKGQLKEQSALDALFMKCIEGFNEFMQIGLAEPKEILEATAGYQTQGQIFQIFLDNQMTADATATTPLATFYPAYQSWCMENGFTPLNKTNIKRIMEQKGIFKATATIGGKTIRNILTGYALPSATVQPANVQPQNVLQVNIESANMQPITAVASVTKIEMDSLPLSNVFEESDYPF